MKCQCTLIETFLESGKFLKVYANTIEPIHKFAYGLVQVKMNF
jgi:hypothetical protein